MSQEERDWLEWLKRAKGDVITQRQAAAKMGVSDRWARKLLARMKTDGDAVVVLSLIHICGCSLPFRDLSGPRKHGFEFGGPLPKYAHAHFP